MNYVIVGFSLCFGRNIWCFFKMQYEEGRRFSQTLKIGWFKLLCTQIFDFVYSFPHYLEPYRGNGLSLEKLSQFLFFSSLEEQRGNKWLLLMENLKIRVRPDIDSPFVNEIHSDVLRKYSLKLDGLKYEKKKSILLICTRWVCNKPEESED